LYDPSGAFVTSGSGFDVGAITTTAAATGTYTVVVADGNSTPDETGAYDLYFTLVPGANEDGALPTGASVSHTLDLGDIDSYTFPANAGEGFLLRVTDFNGTALFPIIRLYDPSGAFVTSGSGANVGSIATTAAATGTYTVVVADGNSTPSQTGDYVLNFALAPGANEKGALPNGGVVSAPLIVGDIDSFTFTANAGESYLLRIADVNGTTLFPQVNVYDPNGAFVTSGSGFDVGSIATTAGATGTYTVMVFDGNSTPDEAGDYDLYFVLAPGANEGGTLPNGGVVSDTIDLGDLDSYTFTARAGNNILLRVADVGATTLFPRILLYDPSGAFVTSGAGFDVGSIITTAGLTGTYTVVVLDGNSTPDETGDYDLHFVRTPGANEGGSLENGVTRFDTIDLGDLDSYTFVGSVGQNAEIIVTDLGPGPIFPAVAVYRPDGTFITSASGAVPATILLPLSVDGLYTVVVLDGNSTPSATGPYSLVLNGAGAVAVPISPLAVVLMALMLAATGTLVLRQQAARSRPAP
ncbi:MAG: PKD domain-containing protein, partial [Myxococcota bacterium]